MQNAHHHRPVAQALRLNGEEFVGLWSIALWVLAAAYLLTTFTGY